MICRRKRPPPMTGGSRRWKNNAFPASGPKKRVEKRNKIADELYLPIEVIDSYNAKLIAPSVDEGYIFIKIYLQGGCAYEYYRN